MNSGLRCLHHKDRTASGCRWHTRGGSHHLHSNRLEFSDPNSTPLGFYRTRPPSPDPFCSCLSATLLRANTGLSTSSDLQTQLCLMLTRGCVVSELQSIASQRETRRRLSDRTGRARHSSQVSPACLRVAGKQALGHGEQQSLWPPYSRRLSIGCFTFFLLRRDYTNPHLGLLPLQL